MNQFDNRFTFNKFVFLLKIFNKNHLNIPNQFMNQFVSLYESILYFCKLSIYQILQKFCIESHDESIL